GSIGQSTLAVIDQNLDKYRVSVLCANTDVDGLLKQIAKYRPNYAAMADQTSARELAQRVSCEGFETEILAGPSALIELAANEQVDTVVAAIVGSAGLPATMSAVQAGKKILLANKETLVCGGRLFMDAVKNSGATLLPIDSEHNAIFQCLNGDQAAHVSKGVSKIYLTGSGGPFRGRRFSELSSITPDEACAHPNWSMGRKISVDSATMMNKGLELIEACWLFDVEASFIDIVLHPQSIIHSMVEYTDGSILAQLGSPDMKTPIAHALAWPERISSGSQPLNLFDKQLSFEKPDVENYPCLGFALQAAEAMGSAPLVLNAANEIAVENFLNHQIGYTDIPSVVQDILSLANFSEPQCIEEVIEQDIWVRNKSTELVYKMAS
ncbi:UNVERIFIED_CONTAM: hypothetical protein GTU68_029864, partial [Idotea baltica]|nr:hypothetical protein [Idotea baltica]